MLRALRFANLAKRTSLVAAGACVARAGVVLIDGGCITAPPPDLPVVPASRPTILHESVQPSADAPLVTWPPGGQFTVPVELDGNQSFYWDVFEDYSPYGASSGLVAPKMFVAPQPSAIDGGTVLVQFTLLPDNLDLGLCHQIEFLVAADFEPDSHTPTSIGGDSVTWNFVPGGGPGCPVYDAGAFQDGAYPAADAPADGLPVTPADAGTL